MTLQIKEAHCFGCGGDCHCPGMSISQRTDTVEEVIKEFIIDVERITIFHTWPGSTDRDKLNQVIDARDFLVDKWSSRIERKDV